MLLLAITPEHHQQSTPDALPLLERREFRRVLGFWGLGLLGSLSGL
jgi:hypothetical protein